MHRTRRKKCQRKLKKKYSKKNIKGGSFQELLARNIAKSMLDNKIPISELIISGYPPQIIKLIENQMQNIAKETISNYIQQRPPPTYWNILKKEINRRIRSKKYDSDRTQDLRDYIRNQNRISPLYDSDGEEQPDLYNSYLSRDEIRHIKALSDQSLYNKVMQDIPDDYY